MKAFKEDQKNCVPLILKVIPLLFMLLSIGSVSAEETQPLTIAGVSREEALRLGEKMYREGILPSGEPMEAVIAGDIHVNGRMFACVSCHQRSGMGSFDGNILSLPVIGKWLYQPLSYMGDLSKSAQGKLPQWMKESADYRPAYTDKTLAIALRAGEGPSGKKFNDMMPKYTFNDREVEILIFYLKNLSLEVSPGVSSTTLRLATVITDSVPKDDLEAMLVPLQFYVNTWGKSRNLARRAQRGAFLDEAMNQGFRSLTLAVWELKGPPESWRKQLEEYYQKDPIFALVGGITTGDWAPIHKFSEDHRIPSLFPITDFPVISETDWYTLYFSKGLYQEAGTVAKYLHGKAHSSKDLSVVQVFRNNRAGLALSRAFQDTWRALGQRPPENRMLDQNEVVNEDFWKQLLGQYNQSVAVLWLDSKDLSAIAELSEIHRPEMIFVSSTLLGQSLYALPDKMRGLIYITYPYRLPQEDKNYRAAVEAWLRNNKLPLTNLDIESKVYDLTMMLSNSLTMLRSYYRDRLLELMDMMEDQWYAIALYPRLSFGQGQRYASKGCYIVQLTDGPHPELVKRSDWVIH